jgi:hypothetical protein
LAQDEKIGDVSDGSRTTPLHVIKLIDQDSSVIWLDESPLLPFSIEKTCGACHNYSTISNGWHFNAGDSGFADGRPGQPWIYVDPYAAIQIPLSYRNWPGVFKPQDFGMSAFEFVTHFGRHMPGGGVGDKETHHSLDYYWRWQVSGKLEINCLSCHGAESNYDQSGYGVQVLRHNFRWAATAASGFATVSGTARDLPDNYDIYSGTLPDQPQKLPPQVRYNANQFNERSEVFFDITRKISTNRCYFCHSSKIIDPDRPERWQFDEDVHLKAGMSCVDCHRHGLDHQMIRGYENESISENRAAAVSLTCRGCHLGEIVNSSIPLAGRLGAPKPIHRGLPPLHLEKLSCTTCHSGTWPQGQALNIKTSQAHGLGLPKINKKDGVLPHIQTPVFIRQENEKIAPHHLIWPSYWAEMHKDTIKIIPNEIITPIARQIISHIDSINTGNWPALADSQVAQVLDSLQSGGWTDFQAVYISSNQIWYLNEQGSLIGREDNKALPYAWPLAHDVRPAEQSLGINGCENCHRTDSDFYFAEIPLDMPLKAHGNQHIIMTKFIDQNAAAVWIFSLSFLFKPWLKYLIIFFSLILTAVLLLYGLRGLSRIIKWLSAVEEKNS